MTTWDSSFSPFAPLLTVREAGAATRQSKATIYRQIKEGQLETVHLGRSVRITRESVEALIERGRKRNGQREGGRAA